MCFVTVRYLQSHYKAIYPTVLVSNLVLYCLLQAIVEKLESDFPSCRDPLRPVAASLRSRLVEVQRPQKELEVA